jgi:hypothetical protein
MHPTLKPRDQWTREEVVGFHLNMLALHVDPKDGLLTTLAMAIEVDPVTLGRWKAQGYVPWHQVVRLQKRYGKKLVPENELCPAENRRS